MSQPMYETLYDSVKADVDAMHPIELVKFARENFHDETFDFIETYLKEQFHGKVPELLSDLIHEDNFLMFYWSMDSIAQRNFKEMIIEVWTDLRNNIWDHYEGPEYNSEDNGYDI